MSPNTCPPCPRSEQAQGEGAQILAIERQDVEGIRLDFVIVLARVQDIEIGNTVDDSFAIDQLICNTEDNEKSFANVSEVAGNSRIKM